MNSSLSNRKVFIAGHNGMVGSAIWQTLTKQGYQNLIGYSRRLLDLRDQQAVRGFFKNEKPDVVIVAAARVGGILANNSYPYQFLMENLQIQTNVIGAAHEQGVDKLVFLGSSCIYPKLAEQPIIEEALLTGSLESTNEWYAVAKIAGLKLCESIRKQFGRDYVSLMPTNLYGPFDNFDLKTSHVLPAMIRKFHEAKISDQPSVEIWGSGTPLREFLHVDDLARAVLFSVENKLDDNLYNVGSGFELSILQLAELIKGIVGFQGDIVLNSSMPDGTPRKIMDSSKFRALGWAPEISLEKGIEKTYAWYLDNIDEAKHVSIN
tara:strand:+ start:632 stop:1594 length:963 start_codon:yes stop_codon:yes gene_type:complete